MKILQSVGAMLRGWMGFRSGIKTSAKAAQSAREGLLSAAINSTESERTLRESEEPREIPVNCPSSPDLRTLAFWLSTQFPAAAALDLIRVKDYTAAHELVGAHDAISALRTLADDLDAAQADAEATQAFIE